MPVARASRQLAPRRVEVERPHDLAARADPLVDFDHALVEQRRQLDPPHEELGPVLVADPQRVGEAARDHERRALALALEQRVGRDRRPHFHRLDRAGGNRRTRREPEQLADAVHRGIAVASGILGQELVGDERAVGPARDDVGERAAAIDPELPAGTGVRRHGYRLLREAVRHRALRGHSRMVPRPDAGSCGPRPAQIVVKSAQGAAPAALPAFPAPFRRLPMNRLRMLLRRRSPSLALAPPSVAAQTKWDMPTAYPANNFHTENIQQFATDVDKATGGKLKITVHPNASLFKAPEIKRAVQGGQAQVGEILLVNFENEDPLYGARRHSVPRDVLRESLKLYKASRKTLDDAAREAGDEAPVHGAVAAAGDLHQAHARLGRRHEGTQVARVQPGDVEDRRARRRAAGHGAGRRGVAGARDRRHRFDTCRPARPASTRRPTSTSRTSTTRRRGCRRTPSSSTRRRSTRSTSRRRRRCSRPLPTPRRAAGSSPRRRTPGTSTSSRRRA